MGESSSAYDSISWVLLIINLVLDFFLFVDSIFLLQIIKWARSQGIILAFYLLISSAISIIFILITPTDIVYSAAILVIAMIIIYSVIGFIVFVAIFALIVLFNKENTESFE